MVAVKFNFISPATALSLGLHLFCITAGAALFGSHPESTPQDTVLVSFVTTTEPEKKAENQSLPRPPKKVRRPDARALSQAPVAHAALAQAPLQSGEPASPEAEGIGSDIAREGAGGRAPRDYFERLLSEIARHKSYPRLARLRGWEGRVVVKFTLGPDGRVEQVSLQDGSPHELLNEAALDLIRSRKRFEAPPAGSAAPLVLRVPVVYSLQGA
jgi:protein TonB